MFNEWESRWCLPGAWNADTVAIMMTQKITMDDNMVDDFFVLYNVMILISSRVAAARIFEMTEP